MNGTTDGGNARQGSDGRHVLAAAGVARCSHVSITVADVDDTVAWWVRVFGYQIIMQRDLAGPAFEEVSGVKGAISRMVRGLVGPGMVLQFFEHNWREPEPVQALVSFEVRDARAAYGQLRSIGVECRSEPVEFENSFAFTTADPNGIPLELIQWKPDAEPYTPRWATAEATTPQQTRH
jgi:catechol 2,3-dioxygenase-like lactoylglutathione lyase family enzyme